MLLIPIALATALLAAGTPPLTDAEKATLARYFGFDTLQIYKTKPGIAHLRIADLDGDGRKDIIFWNGQQSRFEVFYQPQPGAAPAPTPELERNEVPNRGTLRNESIPVNYRVASHEVADVTGDGRPDIVFFGEPRELVVLPGLAQGGFGPVDSVRAPDGEPRGGCLTTGDFNHDGRTDVALLGGSVLQLFLQKPDGGLGKPVRLVHGIPSPLLMLALDLNGDTRHDLIIGSDDDRYGVYVCLQTDSGTMAALRPIRVPRLRSMTVAPALGSGAGAARGDALFGIEFATGRVQLYHWDIAPETGVADDWPQYRYSYPIKSPSKRRPLALGDVDADGRIDVVTVDPDAGQLILFHGERGGLGPGTAYPALLRTSDVCIADIDGDGRPEVVTASPQEKAIGVSRWQEGRLTFPTEAPAQGEPLVVAFGRGATGAPAVFRAYVTRQEDDYHLVVGACDGTAEHKQKLEDVSDDPSGLRVLDLNQDGRDDLLLFVRFAAPQAFLQSEQGEFKAVRGVESRAAMLKEVDPPGAAWADIDDDGRPELLLAQGNIVRALRVKDGRWTVVDQYSAETADAQITGLAALPGNAGYGPTLVMYERKSRELLVQKRRTDGTYGVVQSMPVGSFDVTGMEALPLGASEGVGVLMADPDKVALLVPDQRVPTLVEKQTYQSDAKDAWLADTAIGDVNHDGIRDVVVVDAGKAALEIVTTAPSGELVRALRFQVFQGKRFADSPDMRGQLREVLVGDVTGDGHDDIVLLVHDRLIVYPAQ